MQQGIPPFSAFKKNYPISSVVSASTNHNKSELAPTRATLMGTCLTNRTQPLVGSFRHKVKLMNGFIPIGNAEVNIDLTKLPRCVPWL